MANAGLVIGLALACAVRRTGSAPLTGSGGTAATSRLSSVSRVRAGLSEVTPVAKTSANGKMRFAGGHWVLSTPYGTLTFSSTGSGCLALTSAALMVRRSEEQTSELQSRQYLV